MSSRYSVRYVAPPGWRRIPPVTRALLVLVAAGYLLALVSPAAAAWLMLAPPSVLAGEVWRVLTFPLVNVSIFAVLWDLLLVWSFGSEIEPRWGSRRLAAFVVCATVCAGVLGIVAAVAFPGSFAGGAGCAPTIVALIVAWTLEGPSFPTNFFGVLPMTRLGFAAIAVVLVVFSELEHTRSLPRLLYVLGGLPVAWLFVKGPRGGLRLPRIRNPFRRRRFTVVPSDRVH